MVLPARQAFGIQLVDRKDDLPNAIAMNTTMINVSRFVGPALSGLMLVRCEHAGWIRDSMG